MILWLIRIVASVAGGILLIASSGLLYETEEGVIQNKIEIIWVKLSDAESVAVTRQAKFARAVATLTAKVLDRLFGDKLLSFQSISVSACLSLVSLGIVCLPGTSLLPEDIQSFYVPTILLLLVAALLPAIFKSRLPKGLWLASVAALILLTFVGMHESGWFAGPLIRLGAIVDPAYEVSFLIFTIVCDWLFVICTRWLLRKGAAFHSAATILGVMLGNLALAAILVCLPFGAALGRPGITSLWQSSERVGIVEYYAMWSAPRDLFLMTLAGSNVFDAAVASAFFALFLVMFLHSLVWPVLQRPAYALASRDLIKRRRLFFLLGASLLSSGVLPGTLMARRLGGALKRLIELLNS